MAEQEIKRLHYFDGFFLKEKEFTEEQRYHMHMRRRINYILFEKSGVITVNPGDLEFHIDNSIGKFYVKAGMAVCISQSEKEAKEIILTEDTELTDCEDQKFWVTLHYHEENTEMSDEGGTEGQTRTVEKPFIKKNDSKPGEGEDYVILGAIESSSPTWQENYDDRQEAKIRASLLGGAPAALDYIKIIPETVSIEEGGTLQLTARGYFSDGSDRDLNTGDGLTWLSDDSSVTVVDGLVTGVSLGSATITASAMGKSTASTVNVVESPPVLQFIEIDQTSPTVDENDHIDLTVTGTFEDNVGTVTTRALLNSELTWTSNKELVATVVAYGNANEIAKGRVTGESSAPGNNTADITATSTANASISDTVVVTVNPAVLEPLIQSDPQFNPTSGRPNKDVTIFGSNFGVDLPDFPTVTLIPQNSSITPIEVVVTSVSHTTTPETIVFKVPEISGQTSSVDMLIQVSTSGGDAVSIWKFRWRPPL